MLLDPRGETLDSNAFAKRLRGWNDGGRDVTFVIGGPDGLAPTLSENADLHLAFGALTWPHQLVRIMLLEQIYRAVTILSGTHTTGIRRTTAPAGRHRHLARQARHQREDHRRGGRQDVEQRVEAPALVTKAISGSAAASTVKLTT